MEISSVLKSRGGGNNLLLIYNWIVDMKLIIDSFKMGTVANCFSPETAVMEGKTRARSETSVNRM
jgi:hypothetical protein